LKSRSFTIVDIPDPRKIEARFVYNFFTRDERINDSGDPRVRGIANKNLQRMINAGSLDLEVPRYVEISFDEVHFDAGNYGDSAAQILLDKSILPKIDSEETITNVGFAALRETDDASSLRIKQKIEALSKSLGISFTDSEQSKKIADSLGVSQSQIQQILSPLKDPSLLLVNSKNASENESTVFQMASLAKIHSQINKRLMSAAVRGADDVSPLSKNSVISQAKSISEKFVSEADQFFLVDSDVEPVIQPFSQPVETTDQKKILGAAVIGYVVVRHQYGDTGELIGSRVFVLPGRSNNKYLDSEVLYGTSYSYEVRTIAKIDAVVEGNLLFDEGQDLEEKTNWRIDFLVSSRPSSSVRVRTEEFQAPNEPDGLFYRFNYDEGRGLIMTWQIPSGRSRDTKYFQVFRRKTIFDPFVCIAQIDFDDSMVRNVLREQVRSDRIFSYPGATTFYQDKNFSRDSKYIYAVAAVDAHGFSSGYSAQTEIGFDKIKNSLVMRSISRGGAPKQYPNFYVDPREDDNVLVDSFSQDAIFDSGHKKMTIYFTPDARVLQTGNGDSENAFVTDAQKGKYSLHFINLDLQKAATTTIAISDLRKSTH
jgi:hypothetical protein